MKNSKSRLEYDNVYFLDKRTNETKSKFDIISRDLIYIPRSNNSDKSLSLRSMKLVNNYYDMISKSDEQIIFVTHEFISSITQVKQNQNKNLHNELRNIFNIRYHKSVRVGGRKYRDGFTIEFTENTEKILENPKAFYTNSSNNETDLTTKNWRLSDKKLAVERQKIGAASDLEEPREKPNRSTATEKNFCDEKKSKGSNFQEKSLIDFYPLTEENYQELKIMSKRDFTLNAMNEILLNMSNRLSANPEKVPPSFKSKKGFMEYFSTCLRHEKRDAVKTSNENFRIKNNMTEGEKKEVEVEKYLEGVESSQQVSPESHLKKKLACVLEKHKAYALLRIYGSLAIVGGIAKMHLDEAIDLTPSEHEVVLNQIRATHEQYDGDEYVAVEKLEFVVKRAARGKLKAVSNGAKIPSTPWGTIRRQLIDIYGQDMDGHWFSQLDGIVNEDTKTLEIKAPNDFFQKYVKNNFLQAIENIAEQMSLAVSEVTC